MQITTILPVSRIQYLDRILHSLQNQTHKSQSLIVIFDGTDEEYFIVRNKIVGIGYSEVLCLRSTNTRPAFAISERREHISNIHNQIAGLLGNVDWVFSVEDDGVLPNDALSKLVNVAQSRGDTGMVTGVELGRWGVPYVGAWRVDDVFNTTKVISLESHVGEDLVEEIDGCGLYCGLIRADLYKQHTFNSSNGLGPDVNLGLYLRQCGYKNYIVWDVPLTHLTKRMGIELEIPATDTAMIVSLDLQPNKLWSQTKYGQMPSGIL